MKQYTNHIRRVECRKKSKFLFLSLEIVHKSLHKVNPEIFSSQNKKVVLKKNINKLQKRDKERRNNGIKDYKIVDFKF